MSTVVLGSQIFEIVPTVQATGSSGGDQLTVSAGNTIPAVSGGAGAPSGTPTYGTGTLYVDTTNANLYVNTTGSTWVSINPTSYVSSAVAGTGITVSSGTGAVTITNAGVTSLTSSTTNITLSGSTGAVTISQSQIQASITAAASITSTETLITRLLIGTTVAAGDTYLIQGFGTYTNTSGTARTGTFNVRCGTAGTTADTSLGTIGPMTGTGTATNIPFAFEFLVTFWTVGTTGTAMVNGSVNTNGTSGIIAVATFISGNITAGTINTTTNNYLDITYVTSNASATATFRNVSISKVR